MRLLDAFCGAGGAAMGYSRAGFVEIVGVDITPQPRYPFTFVLGDALEYIKAHGHEFDAIHASPPCQGYSVMRNLPWNRTRKYPLLIAPTAESLRATGVPWVIENVMGAKLASGWLCGTMFGLPFFRHRFFWTGEWFWLQPPHREHRWKIRGGRTLAGRARDVVFTEARVHPTRPASFQSTTLDSDALGHTSARARKALGVEWMRGPEGSQAIPPDYTEFIGNQLLRHLATTR